MTIENTKGRKVWVTRSLIEAIVSIHAVGRTTKEMAGYRTMGAFDKGPLDRETIREVFTAYASGRLKVKIKHHVNSTRLETWEAREIKLLRWMMRRHDNKKRMAKVLCRPLKEVRYYANRINSPIL